MPRPSWPLVFDPQQRSSPAEEMVHAVPAEVPRTEASALNTGGAPVEVSAAAGVTPGATVPSARSAAQRLIRTERLRIRSTVTTTARAVQGPPGADLGPGTVDGV